MGVLDKGRVEVAALGTVADESDPASLCWEIGSITKVFTGLSAGRHGDSRRSGPGRSRSAFTFPTRSPERLPAAALQPTLTDLATHTAGLPRLPLSIYRVAKRSDDPYSHLTEDDVFAYLGPKDEAPAGRRRPRYSNYGTGLLGHLLARAAGRPFAELIEQRILAPVGHDRHSSRELWRWGCHRAGVPQGQAHSFVDLRRPRGGRRAAIHDQRSLPSLPELALIRPKPPSGTPSG